MTKKKESVFTVNIDGQDHEIKLLTPSGKQKSEGQKVYAKTFNEYAQAGVILRVNLKRFMREQGTWDSKREQEEKDLIESIVTYEDQLDAGGISLKEAKQIAIDLRRARMKYIRLTQQKNELDTNTVEAHADNMQFNYLLSACAVYNKDGKPVFQDLNDYIEKSSEDYAVTIANKFAFFMYGLSEDIDASFKENQFLKEYGFVDSDYRLINEKGHPVDTEGRLINEWGQYVDEEGNLVDENGEPVVERKFSPFLDDEGNPVEPKGAEKPQDIDQSEEDG